MRAELRTKRQEFYRAWLQTAHDRDPGEVGCRIHAAGGREFGVSKGVTGEYRGEAGRSDVVSVVWPDGAMTRCKTRGILFKNDRWVIGG